jgi:rubrerythrin
MGQGPMMGGHMGARMGGPALAASALGAPTSAPPLSSDAKTALQRAIEEEYRSEALYDAIVVKFGTRAPFQRIAHSERRHAWILESLALAHGLDLATNNAGTVKQPELANVAAACRAAVESEKKTIALYDELLKRDVPQDLRRAFEHLRAASAQRHLPAFETCR